MDISAKTDYAIRALLALAEAASVDGRPVSVDTLAVRQTLPRKFLEAILGDPRWLVTIPARPAAQVTLGEVFRVVDGPLAEVRGLRPHETTYVGVAEHLPVVWVAVRASLRRVLDGTTLEDVRTGALPAAVAELAADPDAWQNR